MSPAKVLQIGPKGYGMAQTDDGKLIYLPPVIVQENQLKADEEIEVETEPGSVSRGLRATTVLKKPKDPPAKSQSS